MDKPRVQYCRYCADFVTGNGNYCETLHKEPTDEEAKRPNKCKHFRFNEIDAFDITHTYTPRVYKPKPKYAGELIND